MLKDNGDYKNRIQGKGKGLKPDVDLDLEKQGKQGWRFRKRTKGKKERKPRTDPRFRVKFRHGRQKKETQI